MGRPDDRYTKNQDYGRRLYVDDATYEKQMGVGSRKPAFTQNTALYQQSEFKKPYKEDDYEEMEYLSDGFPGFPAPWSYDTPPGAETSNPWHVVFLCDVLASCYGRPDEECNPFKCGWNVTGYKVNSLPNGSCSFKVTGTEICASCPEGTVGWIDFNITMQAKFKHNDATVTVEGTHYSLTINPCAVTCNDSGIAWDYVNSPQTIARETSASVYITDTGTGSPYTWSVSGTGTWSLDNVTTEGLENVLNCGADACGPATITVIGCDGTEITGFVRCTTGSWSTPTNGCQLSGTADNKSATSSVIQMDKTLGKYKQEHWVSISATGPGDEDCADCAIQTGGCVAAPYTRTSCLDWTCQDFDFVGTITCGDWCCGPGAGSSCADFHWCICNGLLSYAEWEC